MAEDTGEVEILLVIGGMVDLGPVSLGVRMEGLGFVAVMEGRMFSETDFGGRIICSKAGDEFVDGVLREIQPHKLSRFGGCVTRLISGAEREPGLGDLQTSHGEEVRDHQPNCSGREIGRRFVGIEEVKKIGWQRQSCRSGGQLHGKVRQHRHQIE